MASHGSEVKNSLSPSHIFWKIAATIPLIILVVLTLSLIPNFNFVAADIDTSTSHTTIFKATNKYSCRFCHMGYPSPMTSEVDGLFEEYRCVSCHIDINSTVTLTEAHRNSPHASTGCTRCHDTVHFGHSGYDIETKGFYGCTGNCHRVVNNELSAPVNPNVYFLDTYVVNNYTGPYSFRINKIRWFYSDTYGGASVKTIYPYNFVDPYTGQAADIPNNKRYWICLKCHFTKIGAQTNQNATYWVTHPDKCYSCHKNTTGYPSSIFLLDPHAIRSGLFTPLNNCGVCHNGVNSSVASSIHSSVGCSCHSVIHISRYNSTASWIYMFYPGTGLYATPETINLSAWLIYYHYDITNTSTYNVPVYPIQLGQDVLYSSIYYLLRDGDASLITDSSLRILTCFNCHFVKDVGGGTPIQPDNPYLIPLPSETLKNIANPHSISPLESESEEPPLTSSFIILIVGVGTAIITVLAVVAAIIRRRWLM